MEQQLNLFSEEDFTSPVSQEQESILELNKHNSTQEEQPLQYDHRALFYRLSQSSFRSNFHLKTKDIAYIQKKGLALIRQHATEIIERRLAPAYIPNDGRQTPMRGHPVFLAQHATGCCCRGCFFKWHHIPANRTLTTIEKQYAVSVIMTWIEEEYKKYLDIDIVK